MKSWCQSYSFAYVFHAWMIFICSYGVVYRITMGITRQIKIVTNTESLHRVLEKVTKNFALFLIIWDYFILSTIVILFIFVPLSSKKGFIVFQTFKTVYFLLLCLALSCDSTSFFLSLLYNFLLKFFCFLYDRKLSAVLILKYLFFK